MEGGSPDQESIESGTRRTSVSSGSRSRNCKEFLRKFVNGEELASELEEWFESLYSRSASKSPAFDVPFELIDLQKFDYALEGIPFQQLIRMPNAVHASTSEAAEATAIFAVEDFLHAGIKGLWETFWSSEEPMPFYVASLYSENLKFYQAEKAVANGKLGGLCGTGILMRNSRHPHGKWDHVLELALLRSEIGNFSVDNDGELSLSVLSEALFYAIRVLLSRSLSRMSFSPVSNSIFVILVDSQYGGVVKVEGDMSKFQFNLNNVYEGAADWIQNHCKIAVSPIDRIWNKLGNANWGDIGALQVLFATFHSITQFAGLPRNSLEDLAADHGSRLQTRRLDRQLPDMKANGNGLYRLQQRSASPEIVEVQDDLVNVEPQELMKLEVGFVLCMEDSNWQKGYQINEVHTNGEHLYYVASPVDEPGKTLFLYVGNNPSKLKPAWDGMDLWYQVQRQTKILTIMKQKGLSSKYLPELSASGRIIHPGQCQRSGGSGGNCDHPWCGTPILATCPVGETLGELITSGRFGTDEAIRCCHDCLSALSAAASAGIRHGDIKPQNVICVRSGSRRPYFVLIGWGHAVLEERDRPAMNVHFSSTFALQEGKLCSASDAESLVYMLYFCCGGESPDLDSVEGALQWREMVWSRRLIQQRLGEVSTLLKAFADYVDSLCGTPYPMDYLIWLRRLKRNMNEEDYGKETSTSG